MRDLEALKQDLLLALDALMAVDLPMDCEDDDLVDWMMDYMLDEPAYVGLAGSALSGAPFVVPPEDDLDELRQALMSLGPLSRADPSYVDCLSALGALERVLAALQPLKGRAAGTLRPGR